MKTDKVLYIEDSASKYMDICKYLKTKGIKTVDWVIPGSIGNIFYNPNRDWELEADELFREIKSM